MESTSQNISKRGAKRTRSGGVGGYTYVGRAMIRALTQDQFLSFFENVEGLEFDRTISGVTVRASHVGDLLVYLAGKGEAEQLSTLIQESRIPLPISV